MDASPKLTDERLRYWLDANQLDRERMCLAIISLDRRFQYVKPRHPRGGPDGGRDLEGSLQDGRSFFAAVGFQNSVSDSQSEQNSASTKFNSDLARALSAKHDLQCFVFMTNVNLTLGQKNELVDFAKSQGIEICDIFDRERLRIVLDSPDGLGSRFQFLGIPLSDAEQATFFARWGTDLHQMISTSIHGLNTQLDRLELDQLRERPLRNIAFEIGLRNEIQFSNYDSLRAFLKISTDPRFNFGEIYLEMKCKRPWIETRLSGADFNFRGSVSYKYPPKQDFILSSYDIGPYCLKAYRQDLQKDQPILVNNCADAKIELFISENLLPIVKNVTIFLNGHSVWSLAVDPSSFEKSANFSLDESASNTIWHSLADGERTLRIGGHPESYYVTHERIAE